MNEANFHIPLVRILIVDDEENTRSAIKRALELLGYQTEDAANGSQAISWLSRANFDLVLLDLNMPEVNGVQVMDYIQTNQPGLAVIVLTAHATLDSAITAIKTGAVDYLLKPQSIQNIHKTIQHAIKTRSTENHRQELISIIENTLNRLKSSNEQPDKQMASFSSDQTQTQKANLILNAEEMTATVTLGVPIETRTVKLTSDQFAILSYMNLYKDKLVTNMQLAEMALKYKGLSPNEADQIIRPHILRIRKKIELDPVNPILIRTIRGAGYLLSSQ